MRRLALFRFWLTLAAFLVVVLNAIGWDDKNLLFFLTSPPNWLLEDVSGKLREGLGAEWMFWGFLYALHLLFWFLLGVLIDRLLGSARRGNRQVTHRTR